MFVQRATRNGHERILRPSKAREAGATFSYPVNPTFGSKLLVSPGPKSTPFSLRLVLPQSRHCLCLKISLRCLAGSLVASSARSVYEKLPSLVIVR